MSIFKKLSIPVLSSVLALAPLKSNALEGIVSNPLTRGGLPNQIVRLYQGEVLKDSIRTDEDGHYNVNATSVTLPEPNLPSLKPFEYVKLEDLLGRKIKTLNQNEITRDIPRRYDLPSGTYFLQADNGSAVQFTTLGKNNIPFDPLFSLEERAEELRESFKNRSRIAGADEEYTLDVNDENTPNEIGGFYGRRLQLEDVNQDSLNVEMMYNPEMENINGMLDLLIHLEGGDEGEYIIDNGGSYPNTYPRTVFLDSISCYRHFRDNEKAEMYLRAGRSAMSNMRERFEMDDYIIEDVDGNLYEISNNLTAIINYTNGRSRFDPDSSIIYINDGFPLENESELENELTHETLHFMGLGDSYDYDYTIMGNSWPNPGITNDDATAIPWRTKVTNHTNLLNFYED